ncbi:MAG TPA: GTP pyrophosphokinase family protein [Candidatus Copromonas avistercoris]|nr:GTP pyrophosphokinase family protein [Candidatus Copromonas avistercoris]
MNIGMNPNGELVQSAVNAPNVIEIPDSFLNEAARFREMMMMYMCAIREVKTKLEVLNDDLAIKNQRNPIQMIKSRVKKPASIVEKLKRRGHPVSVNSIVEHLDDVAGVRVICSFVDDIYTIAEMLARQDDVNVLMVKDYIRSPKVNGYRSYHMIIEIPVFFSDRKQKIRVEVQIRTIAMDFWASLDHQMKYKKNLDDSGEISEELKECAEVIAQTDMRMLNIRRKIEEKECPDKLLRFDRD